jgi:hypothetical protein
LSRLVTLAEREGFSLTAYNDRKPLCFLSLPLSSQDAVLLSTERYASVLEEVVASGYSVREDRKMLWSLMQRLQLRPTSDLFSRLNDSDVVEIYLVPEFIQVFRSFRFFELCNYSLDDLLSRPWWELYDRKEHITTSAFDMINRMISSSDPGTTYYNLGPHILIERDSSKRYRSLQELRFFSPLWDKNNGIAGIVNVVHPIEMFRNENVDSDLSVVNLREIRLASETT